MQRLSSLSASKTAVETPVEDVQQAFCFSLLYGWHLNANGHYFSDLVEAVGDCASPGPTTVLFTRFLRFSQHLMKSSKLLYRKALEEQQNVCVFTAETARVADEVLDMNLDVEGSPQGAYAAVHQRDEILLRQAQAEVAEQTDRKPTPFCKADVETLIDESDGKTSIIGYKLWLLVTEAEFTQSQLWKAWEKSGKFDNKSSHFSKLHWQDEIAPLSTRLRNLAGAWSQHFDVKAAADGHFGQSHFLECQGTLRTSADSNHPLHLFSPFIDFAFVLAFAPEKCQVTVCADQTMAYDQTAARVTFARRGYVMALDFDDLSPALFLRRMLPKAQLNWFFYMARLSAITGDDDTSEADREKFIEERIELWERIKQHPMMQVDNAVTQQILMTSNGTVPRKRQQSWPLTLSRFLDGIYETNNPSATQWGDIFKATPYGAMRFYARKIAYFMSKHVDVNNNTESRYVYEVTRILLHNLFQLTCMNPNNTDLSTAMRAILRVLVEGDLLDSNKTVMSMDDSMPDVSLLERGVVRTSEERGVLFFDGRLGHVWMFLFYGSYQSLRMDSARLNFNVLLLSKIGDLGKSHMLAELEKFRITGTTTSALFESDKVHSTNNEAMISGRTMIYDEFDSQQVGVGPPGTQNGAANRRMRSMTASNRYSAIWLQMSENGKRESMSVDIPFFQSIIGCSNLIQLYTKMPPPDQRRFMVILLNEAIEYRPPAEMLRAQQLFGSDTLMMSTQIQQSAQLQQGLIAIVEALITSSVLTDVNVSLFTIFMPMLETQLSKILTACKLGASTQDRVIAYGRTLCIVDVVELLFRHKGAPFAGKPITETMLMEARPWLDRLLFVQRRHMFMALMWYAPQLLNAVELRIAIALWAIWKRRLVVGQEMCHFSEKDMRDPMAEGRIVFKNDTKSVILPTLIRNELKTSVDNYTVDNEIIQHILEKWRNDSFWCRSTYGYNIALKDLNVYQAANGSRNIGARMVGGNFGIHYEWLSKFQDLVIGDIAPEYKIMEQAIQKVMRNAKYQRNDTFLSAPLMKPTYTDPPMTCFTIETDSDGEKREPLLVATPAREPEEKSIRLGLARDVATERAQEYISIKTELDVWACLRRCAELHIGFDIDSVPPVHLDTTLYGTPTPGVNVDETNCDSHFMGWSLSNLLRTLDNLAEESLDRMLHQINDIRTSQAWNYKSDPTLIDPSYHQLANGAFFGTTQAPALQSSWSLDYEEWKSMTAKQQEQELVWARRRGLFINLNDLLDDATAQELRQIKIHAASVYRLVWPVGYYFEKLILAHAQE